MAVLSDQEKKIIRNNIEKYAIANSIEISWVKGAVNDAAQAVEDLLVSSSSAISSAIDSATSSYGITFTNEEKKAIVAWTLRQKFERDK